mmetsp:Transcript_47385/g.102068  ORF Transcript_47385/g.102068 Transcript_47385/m.102068 type:complete len:269 (+) Transcript_47385:161-967(+)
MKEQDVNVMSGLLRHTTLLVKKIGAQPFSAVAIAREVRNAWRSHRDTATLTMMDLKPLPQANVNFAPLRRQRSSQKLKPRQLLSPAGAGTGARTETPQQDSRAREQHSKKMRNYITIAIVGFVVLVFLATIPCFFQQDSSERYSTTSDLHNDSLTVDSAATRQTTTAAVTNSRSTMAAGARQTTTARATTRAATTKSSATAAAKTSPAAASPAAAAAAAAETDAGAAKSTATFTSASSNGLEGPQSVVVGQVRSMKPHSDQSLKPEGC